MQNFTDGELIKKLAKIFGNHSAASKALGYKNPSTYRKARKNGLPVWRREIALRLIEESQTETAA